MVLGKKILYKPKNVNKCKGKFYKDHGNTILFKSKLELIFGRNCDLNPKIVEWSYETVIIPYWSTQENKQRNYYVDFFAKSLNTNGQIETYLVEIKPMDHVRKGRRRHFEDDKEQIQLNYDKWSAAEKFCKSMGWYFRIYTESELMPKK